MCLLNHIGKKQSYKTKITIRQAFIFTFVVTLLDSLFLCMAWVAVSCHLILVWTITFGISYRAGLLAINSLNFCLSGSVLVSLSLSKQWFIYSAWLCWVFTAAWGLSLAAAVGGHSSLCYLNSLRGLLLRQSTGSRLLGFSSCSPGAL